MTVPLLLLGSIGAPIAEAGRTPDRPTEQDRKKVVLIAGKKSHGPLGNGIHDYPWSVKLLKVMLDNSNVRDRVAVEYHENGWPEDPSTLDTADTIMIISDGRDGHIGVEAPQFRTLEQQRLIEKQMKRGCGFLTFHFSTFAPDSRAKEILEWSGGYFDWETDGERKWYSAIETIEADVQVATPDHPVSRGLSAFRMREEFYFNMRFPTKARGWRPIWDVPALPGRDESGRTVAWVIQRKDGGRGFGTTCGHYYDNWKHESFRKMILNAIAWTAHVDVPERGITSRYYSRAEITAALAGKEGTAKATYDDRPVKTLILTGHQHGAHVWQETTKELKKALGRDTRLQVDVSTKIEDLATPKISQYDLLLLNYCNWERPGLSDAAKASFVRYLKAGGGLIIVHFANGAFHFSLPNAADSDWPEYRQICRRVWEDGKSGHDAYGRFVVEIDDGDHPITRGIEPFATTDELYFRQQGTAPIRVLASAKSQVTGQSEPMAFVYDYGDGRVFQTVLGHAAESIRSPGTSTMLARAAAWVARRNPRPVSLLRRADSEADAPLVEGRFGRALNARVQGAWVAPSEKFQQPPLTVELWAKLTSQSSYNILVAQEAKASGTHWEIFSMTKSGLLTVYVPGMNPDHVRSEKTICDGEWHYVAMQLAPDRIRLYVDAELVADQAVRFLKKASVVGPLTIGQLVRERLGCHGAVEEVRISRGLRPIESIPEAPFEVDETTVSVWSFDALTKKPAVTNDVEGGPPATLGPAPAQQQAAAGSDPHFGKGSVGFEWTENDSRDNRWQRTNIGRWLASSLPLPNGTTIAKALSVRVGQRGEATVCYDMQTLQLHAAWTGGFLKFDPMRFGIISAPRPGGTIVYQPKVSPAWQGHDVRFLAQIPHRDRLTLKYDVDGTVVHESPWAVETSDGPIYVRQFLVGPSRGPRRLNVRHVRGGEWLAVGATRVHRDAVSSMATWQDGLPDTAMRVDDGQLTVTIPPSKETQTFTLAWASMRGDNVARLARAFQDARLPNVEQLTKAGPAIWGEPLRTVGRVARATDDDAYVVDTIPLPFENPHRALFFIGGHDFFSDGSAAVCTMHGDVWIARGLDTDLRSITWHRFATGLFQPLGLKIVDDRVFVLGRDQITALHDRNGDLEADYYESFHNAIVTSTGGHDYVTCLETDTDGDFYYVHATQGVVRVSRDGRRSTIVGTGLRNPNGLSVGTEGWVTAAPQEGTWTPASNIAKVVPGGYYGFGGPRVTDDRPLGYDPPLCWIPRLQDNSSGGQVWVNSQRWGPLAGQLLHLSFGQSRMMLVLREEVEGVWQGGTVAFPLEFLSGVMRGRFHPIDGQLYVSGSKGWVSNAVQDGCFQRVRFTGGELHLPVGIRTYANGLALSFATPLQAEAATDPGRFAVETWNYRYSENYGSEDYRPSAPNEVGHDELPVLSATLLDSRTVFLELDDLQPAMQVAVRYAMKTEAGRDIRQTYFHTLHRIPADAIDESRITRRTRRALLSEEERNRLRRGWNWHFTQDTRRTSRRDARRSRMIALAVADGTSATPFLEPGPFHVEGHGYVRVPLSSEVRFSLQATATDVRKAPPHVRLLLGGQVLFEGEIDGHAVLQSDVVTLQQGYNPLRIEYATGGQSAVSLRLFWEGDDFASEPVPPHLLWADGADTKVQTAAQPRLGRRLFRAGRCGACHVFPSPDSHEALNNTASLSGPDLTGLSNHLRPAWVFEHILEPQGERSEMPQLLGPADGDDARRAAADLVAWLWSRENQRKVEARRTVNGDADAGLALYESLSCLACHHTLASGEDEFGRQSLHHVGRKFRGAGLEDFLQDPFKRHADGRMPDFQLASREAADIATWLRKEVTEMKETAVPAGNMRRGGKLFVELNCVACHKSGLSGGTSPIPRPTIPLNSGAGCLQPDRFTIGVPRYDMSESQRIALHAFLETGGHSLARLTPSEEAGELVARMNCLACHDRDGVVSPRRELLAEEGLVGLAPEVVPDLTWSGEKLHAHWTRTFLINRRTRKLRPWLKTRMPRFAPSAAVLADGLSAEHGLFPSQRSQRPTDRELAGHGARLVQRTALDCQQCHGIGKEPPRGDAKTQIAFGIHFSDIRDRVRPEYFHRFLLDPPRFDRGSKMPKLSADGRTTKVTDVLDGDAARQFEAIWHFILSQEASNSPQ